MLREARVPRHIVCLTFDFDTQSGFIARGMTTPTPLSRGEFGLIGAQRILALMKASGIRTTWFIPGFTIESHPAACAAVVEGGHEVAHHSWAHVPPAQQSRDEEEADLIRANAAIARLTGRKARGYRSPAWDLSEHTIDLLLAHGFVYNSSLMGADYRPYRARRGDRAELGKPFQFGEATALIEMPISWSLDDYPHFEFMRTAATVMPGLQSAHVVMENWFDEFLLHAAGRRLGRVDLDHAPLRDRARLPHARVRGAGAEARPHGRGVHALWRTRPPKPRRACSMVSETQPQARRAPSP